MDDLKKKSRRADQLKEGGSSCEKGGGQAAWEVLCFLVDRENSEKGKRTKATQVVPSFQRDGEKT